MARALSLIPFGSKTSPIIVRLSGHAQTNDRLAIREMGRQIADAEGIRSSDADDDVQDEPNEDEVGRRGAAFLRGPRPLVETIVDALKEYAPTTLPSHLLALLTAPSPRAIIIIIEEFDMFTEHARQALLYCLCELQMVVFVCIELTRGSGRGAERKDWSGGDDGTRSGCDWCDLPNRESKSVCLADRRHRTRSSCSRNASNRGSPIASCVSSPRSPRTAQAGRISCAKCSFPGSLPGGPRTRRSRAQSKPNQRRHESG